jgi:hypothetical protein
MSRLQELEDELNEIGLRLIPKSLPVEVSRGPLHLSSNDGTEGSEFWRQGEGVNPQS